MSNRITDRVRLATYQQFASLLLMVAFAIVSARWLGPAGKGQLAMVTTAGIVSASILGLGLPQAISIRVARGQMDVRSAFTVGVVVCMCVTVVTALVSAMYGRSDLAISLLWLSVGSSLFDQVLQGVGVGSGDMSPLLRFRIVGGFLQVAVVALALSIDLQPSARIAAYACFGVSLLVAGWSALSLVRRAEKLQPRTSEADASLGAIPALLRFGLAAMPAQLLTIANARADLLVLGAVAGDAPVGVYSLAVSASLLVGLVPAALGQALTSTFGAGHDSEENLRLGFQAALLIGLGMAAAMALLAPYFVPLIFGREFAQASILITVMVPFTALFSTVQVSAPYFYAKLGRPKAHSAVIGTAAVLDIILVLILAPRMGALGAALASALAYGTGAVLNASLTARGAGIPLRALVLPDRQSLGLLGRHGLSALRSAFGGA